MSDLDYGRRRFLEGAAMTLAAARLGVLGAAAERVSCAALAAHDEGAMPSLAGATAWLNSAPLSPEGLRGKVVLVQFWTYTCVNWMRTLPYVRAWAKEYGGRGLVTIGVHSPEFSFEADVDNVRQEARALNVPYPIAVDSDHAVWRAFDNAYWPALYLVDARGRVRYHHFGEGDYDGSERTIQRLLRESGAADVGDALSAVDPRGVEVGADWRTLRSPESYVGLARAEGFASPGGAVPNERRRYAVPQRLEQNEWALSGEWTVAQEAAASHAPSAAIAFRFHARDLNLVAGPATRGASVRFRVRLDRSPPGPAHGGDADAEGNGVLVAPRLYQLVRQSGAVADRQFEITFLDPGAAAYCFTFG